MGEVNEYVAIKPFVWASLSFKVHFSEDKIGKIFILVENWHHFLRFFFQFFLLFSNSSNEEYIWDIRKKRFKLNFIGRMVPPSIDLPLLLNWYKYPSLTVASSTEIPTNALPWRDRNTFELSDSFCFRL